MVERLFAALRDEDFVRNTYVAQRFRDLREPRLLKGRPLRTLPMGLTRCRGTRLTPGYVDDRPVANLDLAPILSV